MKTIAVLGHKDHGKSTLLGRLLFDTKSITPDRVQTTRELDEEAGREFEWAHLLDAFKEEREQEMTYDTASVFIKGSDGETYTFVDVPGHKELVHQMLSGASTADAAILIVSAVEGIEEMNMTHLMLAGLLGIKKLAVVVNKMDAKGYSQEVFDVLKQEIKEMMETKGFDTSNIRFFPVSAKEGDNIAHESKNMPWYEGGALFPFVETLEREPIDDGGTPLRMLVQDVHSNNDNMLLAGHIQSGELRRGDDVVILPQGVSISPQEILSLSGESIERAQAGMNIALEVDEEPEDVRGSVIAPHNNAPAYSDLFTARAFFFKKPTDEMMLECGKMSAEANISEEVKLFEIFSTDINLANPVLCDTSETYLHRFVFKQGGNIIGVGVVDSV